MTFCTVLENKHKLIPFQTGMGNRKRKESFPMGGVLAAKAYKAI
jgi:hypothetical protein